VENQAILNSVQVKQIIKRLAYEIFENNYQERELIIAGIFDKGYLLADLLYNELKTITSSIQFSLLKVELDKNSLTQSEIKLNIPKESLKDKAIVLVDDVLNSGRTLAYSLKPFLNIEIKKIMVAVLVDRGHKSFPVSADFIGYSLSTTLKEHIEVVFTKGEAIVYLK